MPRGMDRIWEAGVDWLKEAGCAIVEVSLPHTRYALPAYYIVAPAEAGVTRGTKGVRARGAHPTYHPRDGPQGA